MYSFQNNDTECNICFIQSNKWQLLPCMHKLCKKCFNLLQDNKCPWCRIKIKRKNKPRSERNRSYSVPLHNRDTLRTPIDVIEHENRIERYMNRKNNKRIKDCKENANIDSERRRFFNNNLNFKRSKFKKTPKSELLYGCFY